MFLGENGGQAKKMPQQKAGAVGRYQGVGHGPRTPNKRRDTSQAVAFPEQYGRIK